MRSNFVLRPTAMFLLLITVLVFALHIGWMLWTGTFHARLDGDEPDYYNLAQSLIAGRGYVALDGSMTANRAPLYPIFVAFIGFISPAPELVRVAQALLAALGLPLVWYIGTALGPRGTGWLAAFLYAVNPYVMHQTRFLLTETLLTFLLLVLGALCVRIASSTVGSADGAGWKGILSVGVVLGLCIATRGQVILTAAFLLPWLCVALKGRLYPARTLLLVAGGIALVLSPWIVRNFVAFGQFIPLTAGKYASTGGYVFWTSNNEISARRGEHWGAWVRHERLIGYSEYAALPDNDPLLADRKGYELGLRFLREHPEAIPDLLVGKLQRFLDYNWVIDAPGLEYVTLRMVLSLVPFFLVGLVFQLLHWRRHAPLLAIMASCVASVVIYYGYARFRGPIEPYITLTIAMGLALAVSGVHRLRAGRAS